MSWMRQFKVSWHCPQSSSIGWVQVTPMGLLLSGTLVWTLLILAPLPLPRPGFSWTLLTKLLSHKSSFLGLPLRKSVLAREVWNLAFSIMLHIWEACWKLPLRERECLEPRHREVRFCTVYVDITGRGVRESPWQLTMSFVSQKHDLGKDRQ